MEIQLRKTQSNLISSGIGVMIFAIWSFMRTLLYLINGDPYIKEVVQEASDGNVNTTVLQVLLICAFLIVAIIDVLLRFYICRCAVSEGKGNRKKSIYLVMCCYLIIFYLFGIGAHVAGISGKLQDYDLLDIDTLLSLIIDLTSLYIVVLLVTSAFKLRKLLKQREAEYEPAG